MNRDRLVELLLKITDAKEGHFQLKDKKMDMPIMCTCQANAQTIACWNGEEVWAQVEDVENFIHSVDAKNTSVHIQVPICIYGGNGMTDLYVNSKRYYALMTSSKNRIDMAIYDLLYRLFDKKVELDLKSFDEERYFRLPKEWKEREIFGDMPHAEDMKLNDSLWFENVL